MGRALGHTAAKVGASERTLRRYIGTGLLRGRRVGDTLELPASEERYLIERHALLAGLRAALRTERNVRLAVLFGSVATGDDRDDSDVDLVVDLTAGGQSDLAALRRRLQSAIDRRVQLVALEDAERFPSLLVDVLEDGRVLIDRDDLWTSVVSSRELVVKRARREQAALMRKATAAVSASRRRARA
jgi:predicted nucleotidyltransferase